jgi:prepilin-type N-terminal cleavage/methylation domain-containing protein
MRSARGFTLLEVLVALAIVVGVVTASAQLVSMAVRATLLAGTTTTTVVLAQQKLEEILSETDRMPIPSPAGALAGNIEGCFDYVDRRGHVRGGGATPPPGSDYLRRWSVDPLAGSGAGTLVVQVLVIGVRSAAEGDASTSTSASRRADRVRIAAAQARRAF